MIFKYCHDTQKNVLWPKTHVKNWKQLFFNRWHLWRVLSKIFNANNSTNFRWKLGNFSIIFTSSWIISQSSFLLLGFFDLICRLLHRFWQALSLTWSFLYSFMLRLNPKTDFKNEQIKFDTKKLHLFIRGCFLVENLYLLWYQNPIW